MITKNHPSAYSDLFAKANEVLKKHGNNSLYDNIDITNIDEYFACLKDLADIEAKSERGEIEYIDPIFTILPATESTFNIDADKRSISIPDNFARYGVGVQGDEIAEILYFSIDRYFDAMDLADMDIIVQWKHEKDEDHVSNLSATYKKSLTLQPGKIVFGWPITSEVTERSGNIKFSIRFYRRNENTLEYSFSTLTATIKIQSGLDFELDKSATDLAINKNSLIYSNLRNSKKVNVGYVIAAPTFEGFYTWNNETLELEPAATTTYDLPQTFVVKAAIPANTPDDQQVSGSGVTYSWYKKDNNNASQEGHHIYQVSEGPYNPYEIYYIKNEDGTYEPYGVHGDSNPFDDIEPVTVYTRYGAFTPATAGIYVAEASNVYAPGAASSVLSSEWIVPYAAEPSFTYANEKLILDDEGKAVVVINHNVTDNGEVSTEWYSGPNATLDGAVKIDGVTGNSYEATAEGYYFLKADNTKNNSTTTAVSKGVWVRHNASDPVIDSYKVNGNIKTEQPYGALINDVLTVVVKAPTYGTISYQWRQGGINIEGATMADIKATSAGSFDCIITNTYKESVKTIQSDAFSVS